MKIENKTAFDARPLRYALDKLVLELGQAPARVLLAENAAGNTIEVLRIVDGIAILGPRAPKLVLLAAHLLAIAEAIAKCCQTVTTGTDALVGSGLRVVELFERHTTTGLKRAGRKAEAVTARRRSRADVRVGEVLRRLETLRSLPVTPNTRREMGRQARLLVFWNRHAGRRVTS